MQRGRLIRGIVITTVVTLSMTAWVMNSAGQGVRPVPGAGTGIIQVEGTVNVGNTPTVQVSNMPPVTAIQSGEWRVSVTGTPTVTVPSPDFLQFRRAYTITWPNNATERIVVDQIGANGWVRSGRRWFNLAQALSVEDTTK